MRRTQFYVDDAIYDALTAEAARLGTSRSAIVREAIRASLTRHSVDRPDPLDALLGSVDIDPIDDIDAVIYDYDGAADSSNAASLDPATGGG